MASNAQKILVVTKDCRLAKCYRCAIAMSPRIYASSSPRTSSSRPRFRSQARTHCTTASDTSKQAWPSNYILINLTRSTVPRTVKLNQKPSLKPLFTLELRPMALALDMPPQDTGKSRSCTNAFVNYINKNAKAVPAACR